MDPLSFTASLLTIIHAARVGAQALRQLNAYRRAPQVVHRLRSELDALEGLLGNVRTFITENRSGPYCEILKPPLDCASSKIDRLNKILTSPAFRLSRLSDANKARLTWLRYKHSLAALEQDIKDAKTDLGVRLTLVTASSAGQIGNSLDLYIRCQDRVSHQLSSVLDKMAISDFEAAQERMLLDEQSKAEDSSPVQIKDSRCCEDLEIDSHPEPKSEASLHALANIYPSKAEHLVDGDAKVRKCSKSCTCSCHIKSSLKSPWALTAMLGELNIRYNSQRAKNECSCANTFTFDVTYRFPHYLIQRYLSLALKFSVCRGPELLLRIPRIMPWSHLLWRYSVKGDISAVQRMYERGLASPYDINQRGQTALSYAVEQSTSELAHFFLDQGVDPDFGLENRTPGELIWDKAFAGQWGSSGFAVVRHMLRYKDDVDDLGFSTLHKVVLDFVHKDVKSVLEACTDSINSIDFRGRTPLIWAVIRDDITIVETLLAFKADPHIKDQSGITAMDCVRSPNVCKALLKAGATDNVNIAYFGRHSIHTIVKKDTPTRVIDCLVEAGFNIDVRDADGETPLLNAIYHGKVAVAKRLIELGADVNATNISSCDSAIHFASSFDCPEILPLLLTQGADYNKTNIHGRDIGHCAARFAGPEFIKVMSQSNLMRLDLDLRDKEGKSARDYIAERIILTESELGVHEAFEELITSLPAPAAPVGNMEGTLEDFDIESQISSEKYPQIPGAFPGLG